MRMFRDCLSVGWRRLWPAGAGYRAQKEAMQKLSFLVGKWEGDASIVTMKGPLKVRQTELVQYKLDGLVMMVEGTGRDPEKGNVRLPGVRDDCL